MSFALYGPVATFTKTYITIYNEVSLKLVGDKILMHVQGANEWALYDLKFNKIATLKNTTDFARIYNLTVHRYGKSVEVYSGYGDGESPRCPNPYGTCASELERYTYGSSTTEMLCPNENCEEGNVHPIFYDAVTGKLIVGTSNSGNKLYLIDPDTKAFTKWSARGSGMTTHFTTTIFIYDDNILYVVIKKYPEDGGSFEIRKFTVSEFYSVFGSGNIEDYGERVYYEASSTKSHNERLTYTLAPYRKTFLIRDIVNWADEYEFDPTTNTLNKLPALIDKRILGRYGMCERGVENAIDIYDIETIQIYQTVSYPAGKSVHWSAYTPQTDPPFFSFYDGTKIYIYLLTYNGVAPVIQYDHSTRKIRVVDYITGNPISAELWIWKSRFCYPRDVYPPGITPSTLSVSDWTPIPSATKSECLTFAIKDIVA